MKAVTKLVLYPLGSDLLNPPKIWSNFLDRIGDKHSDLEYREDQEQYDIVGAFLKKFNAEYICIMEHGQYSFYIQFEKESDLTHFILAHS